MVKEYTQSEVDEISAWAKSVNRTEPIKVEDGTIFDVHKYIEAHINDLKKGDYIRQYPKFCNNKPFSFPERFRQDLGYFDVVV